MRHLRSSPCGGNEYLAMATIISIANGGFALNGTPTYAGRSWKGHRIEGLLFNSRMANAIADDENPATRGAWSYADGDWDAERSTREFIAALPVLSRARPAGGLPQHPGRQPAGLFLAPAVEDRRLHGRRHDQARLGRPPRQGHQGLRRRRHGGDPRPLLRQAEPDPEGRGRGEGRRHQHRRLAPAAQRHQRAARDRQRGRPAERVRPSHHHGRSAATS